MKATLPTIHIALALVLLTAAPALAGTIRADYDAYLDTLPADQKVSVIVSLAAQAPIADIDRELEATRATLAARHARVIGALQETAAATQPALLADLDARRGAGEVTGYTPYWISNLVVAEMTVRAARAIADRADVDMVEPNFTAELISPVASEGSPNEVTAATNSLRAINAHRVWYDLGITGAGSLVAGCDTGVLGSHTALSSRWRGTHVPWQQAWLDVLGTNTQSPNDGNGHGTHTMGTIAGLGVATGDTVGVAFGAEWIACNAINQGVGAGFDNDIIASFQWFSDPDGLAWTTDDVPDVVGNSWRINEGFPGGYSDCDSRWWAVIDGCEAAGCAAIFAAGNEGSGAQTIGSPADRITTLTNAYAIGAVDGNGAFPFPIASFSSRGPSGCAGTTTQRIKPEVSAPGVSVRSSWNSGGYINLDGTSMATPHVAGTVALMRQARPNLGVTAMKDILIATARDLGTAGEDNTYGWGVIDAYAAVRQAQCANPIALASGTSVATPFLQEHYSFNQQSIYWTAVAVRKPSEDWDMAVYSGPCQSGPLASSTYVAGTTDFVIGDFNHNAFQPYYVYSYKYSGTGGARTEWDSGADAAFVNGAFNARTTDANDLLEVWDVYLEAGTNYTFEFSYFGANAKLLLFRNPSAGTYWAGRSSRVVETQALLTNYTAPASDWYGVVVVNDDGGSGGYSWRVGTCNPPVALASGVSAYTPTSLGRYSFTQPTIYWSAVGVRSTEDWDIRVDQSAGGGSFPVCSSGMLANSVAVGVADFVIGDFNHNPLGTYYPYAYQWGSYDPPADAVTEWDDGSDQIVVGDPPILRSTDASDVLEVWDVFLDANIDYDIVFERGGDADTKLFVFQSQNGVYWAGRSQRVLETTNLHTPFTAPASDWYGIVVVNDNGAGGQYRLGISPATAAIDQGAGGAAPRLTTLHPTAPNPARGEVEIAFDLAASEAVTFDILDVAGRVVATLPARDWAAGSWQTRWNLRADDGGCVPAGVYWVRMSLAGGREVGRNKFIVLR
jgi:subtilisin family serine protease